MANYNIEMQKRDATNTGWDKLYPITKAENVFDSNGNSVAAHLVDITYQLATGTATAIIVSTATLANGYTKTFIASANNAAAATTINGKPLYKPNTTTSPSLVAGKAYTVWYNLSGDCFFIKASAEGNTVAAHVLAGDTFSNDNDTGLAGTMVDRSGDTAAVSSTVSGTTLKLKASEGYRDGVNDFVTLTDADFIAANIKNTINLFGLVGTFDAKRKATGTGTSNGSGIMSVTGLAFTPSVIILWWVSSTTYIMTYNPSLTVTDSNGYPFSRFAVRIANFQPGVNYETQNSPLSPNASGFTAGTYYNNTAFNWIAYE